MFKTNQKGAISTGAAIALGLFGFLIVVIIAVVANLISVYNYGNRMENQLNAIKENNQNIYTTYVQKVQEVAQVPEMARDDMVKIVSAALEGRYGADGSKATFQFLKEQNPNIDPQLYRKIQQVIESGRNEFKTAQTNMIDVKRSYTTALGSAWTGTMLHVVGYPKIDLNQFKAIASDASNQVFSAGKESGPVKLR